MAREGRGRWDCSVLAVGSREHDPCSLSHVTKVSDGAEDTIASSIHRLPPSRELYSRSNVRISALFVYDDPSIRHAVENAVCRDAVTPVWGLKGPFSEFVVFALGWPRLNLSTQPSERGRPGGPEFVPHCTGDRPGTRAANRWALKRRRPALFTGERLFASLTCKLHTGPENPTAIVKNHAAGTPRRAAGTWREPSSLG